MGRYSNEFKQSMIQKLLLPGGPSATALAETSGHLNPDRPAITVSPTVGKAA